jgi:hypothetical protein
MEISSDRASGPDGFSSLFFKLAWEVIAEDMMATLDQLHKGNLRNSQWLNSSIFILLPKNKTLLISKSIAPLV